MKVRTALLVTLTCLLAARVTASDIPHQMEYQGRLTKPDGTSAADANYPVTIRIYDAPTGGTTLWTEIDTLRTTAGLFSLILGKNSPLLTALFTGATRYLGVQPDNDGEMFPRTALVSVPYSIRSYSSTVADSANYALQAITVTRSRDVYHEVKDIGPNSNTAIHFITRSTSPIIDLYLFGSQFQSALAEHTHSGVNSHSHGWTGDIGVASLNHSHSFSGGTSDANLSHNHGGVTSDNTHRHTLATDGAPGTGNYLVNSSNSPLLSSSNNAVRFNLGSIMLDTHNHTLPGDLGVHSHVFSGITGAFDLSHSHSVAGSVAAFGSGLISSGVPASSMFASIRVYLDGTPIAGPFSGAFAFGPLALGSYVTTVGVHLLEVREEGGSGGRIEMNLYVE